MHSQIEYRSGQTAGGVTARTCLLLLCAALMVLPAGCGKRRIKETPAELIGFWKTSYEGLQRASMEFTTEYFIIGTIENTTNTYALTGFLKEEAEQLIQYKIFYMDANRNELSMELTYTTDDGGTLRDMHQLSVVWKKQP